jgi:hypothetical protein
MRRPPKHAAPTGQRRARAESWQEAAADPAQQVRPPAAAADPLHGGHPAWRRSGGEWPAQDESGAVASRLQATLAYADEAGALATDGVPPWELRNGGTASPPGPHEQPAADMAAAQPAPDQPSAAQLSGGYKSRSVWPGWHSWRLSRPFWGAAVAVAGSTELALTGGMADWFSSGGPSVPELLLAVGLVLCALMLCFHPVWRSAYATVAVLLAVIALMTDHVGGYLAGSLLAAVGGAIAFAWVPASGPAEPRPDGPRSAGQSASHQGPIAAGTWPDVHGQVPELTLIRGEAITLPGLPPLNQRPASAPASAFGLGTLADE